MKPQTIHAKYSQISLLGQTILNGVAYPDDDEKRMSDNSLQFDWILMLKYNFEFLFQENPNVFVAGNLLWYPVEGENKTRLAPDLMVVFGRPNNYRGSYIQWLEEDIAPQVVVEVLSPGNRRAEMQRKRLFYERFGVEEYYQYNPTTNDLKIWRREHKKLRLVAMAVEHDAETYVSPRTRVKFKLTEAALTLYYPNGKPFENPVEITNRYHKQEQVVKEEKRRADKEKRRADKLAGKLRELGIDPDSLK
jgi:Uma2 family endonuclease